MEKVLTTLTGLCLDPLVQAIAGLCLIGALIALAGETIVKLHDEQA